MKMKARLLLISLTLLASHSALAVETLTYPIADGQTVQLRVLAETDDTVTLATNGEVKKFNKSELPPVLQKRFPPRAQASAAQKNQVFKGAADGSRFLTIDEGDDRRRWGMIVSANGGVGFTLQHWDSSAELWPVGEQFGILPRDVSEFGAVLKKSGEWDSQLRQKKAPALDKDLAKLSRTRVAYSWSDEGTSTLTISTEGFNSEPVRLAAEDIAAVSTLLQEYEQVRAERVAIAERATEAADSLK